MVDLNSDVGEGYGAWAMGDDGAMLGIVTSANIACGFHAGDPHTMHRTVDLAVANGVAIGAHVSFPDRQGFGRRDLDVAPAEVTEDVLYQIGALDAFARAAGTRVGYVKAHGALYHRMAGDEALAGAVVDAMVAYRPGLPLLTPPGSVAAGVAARAGLVVVTEGFADRGYRSDGGLVPRGVSGAVIGDPAEAGRRAVGLASGGTVVAVDGTVVEVAATSLCVHGDSPGAVSMARAVRGALEEAGIAVASFVARR